MNTSPAPTAKVLKKKTVLPSGAVFLAIGLESKNLHQHQIAVRFSRR
jgi:hypothetical protein